MGPSGSGKTTLLNLVGGLDSADHGEVWVAGEDLATLSGSELARWRADNVGFVFQGFNLLPVLTAVHHEASGGPPKIAQPCTCWHVPSRKSL